MLSNAVKTKNAQQQDQSKALAQQIFSSSPIPIQQPGTSGLTRAGSDGGQPLKPSSPSKVNGISKAAQRAQTVSRKWPLSGPSQTSPTSAMGGRGFSNQSTKQAVPTAFPRTNSGLLNKLHQDVSFDEFEDDADINLDDPIDHSFTAQALNKAVSYPVLPGNEQVYPKDEPHYPTLPELPAQTPTPKASQSSAAFMWSSSPLAHLKPVAQPAFKKPTQLPMQGTLSGTRATGSSKPQAPVSKAQHVKPVVIDLDIEEVEPHEFQRPAKRRGLPWSKTQAANTESLGAESSRMKRPKKEHTQTDIHTPLSNKVKGKSLWEQTASAVKAEQKKHRQESGARPSEKDGKIVIGDSRKVKTSGKKAPNVFLSEEQKRVLNLVIEGKKSVFFTGSAGTGKSVLMREIIAQLRSKYKGEADRVAVTASTGLAACNIGGNTLHSFASIGLGKESVDQLCKKIRRNQKAMQRWQRTKVLVVDEISMIDGELFDKLEGIARNIRKKATPFGGIQLVITGDFFQLPPVGNGSAAKFSFDANTWNTCIDHTIGLTHVFRQKDPVFAGMLNEMRVGKLTPDSIRAFHKLSRPLVPRDETDDVEATELFPTRYEVEQANQMRLKRLVGNTVDFPALDGGTLADAEQRTKLLSNCMAPPGITLKKGAQVMLIKNIDDTLVNGSIGKIVGFMDEKTFDYYDENEQEFISTAPSLDADPQKPGGRPNLQGFANPAAGNVNQKWPVVRFQIADGTSRDLLCQRETWKIEQPNGEVLASRSQIPLILAWALSIHKAQGQTLEKVKVDLGKVFEKGQAYVALSRATTQSGLQVRNFNPSKVQAHERVRRFYDSLYGVETIASASIAPASKNDRVKTNMFAEDEFAFGADEEDMMAQIRV